MSCNRREFVQTLLAGAVGLSVTGTGFASRLSRAHSMPSAGSDPFLNELAILDDLERTAFEYFWQQGDPYTGLVRDRAKVAGNETNVFASVAATGFGLTAMCIGHERHYRSRAEIQARVRRSLNFMAEHAPTVRGFLYHWVDMRNGKRLGRSEISPIDMSILLCGVLACREYFHDPEIHRDASKIYHRVDWTWALNDGKTFALDWTPEYGFSPLRWDAYCESMMLYLLGMGSPTHAIPADSWHAVRRPWLVYKDYRFISIPAPLFVHQYSHAWFDFRNKQDDYANYFENSVTACRAHRQFCEDLSSKFPCYSPQVWGITASDSSRGYVVWGGPPTQGPIDGTIVPAAAAGSLPFLLPESLAVLRNLRAYYGKQIWKRYGFADAFNPLTGWVSTDALGIDVGIGMLMAENARSQFVWNTFMRSPEVNVAMEKAGFHSTAPVAVQPETSLL